MTATAILSVADVPVSQDANGRYNLNDLHRAAGSENRQRPSLWVENAQTKALIEEASKAGIPALETVRGGAFAGTYVVRELVYAYAMWISAAFHLKVIKAYDALVSASTGTPRVQAPGRNVFAGVRERRNLARMLGECTNAVVARGYYRCLQLVDRELGIETEPIEEIAPIVKQTGLPGV